LLGELSPAILQNGYTLKDVGALKHVLIIKPINKPLRQQKLYSTIYKSVQPPLGSHEAGTGL